MTQVNKRRGRTQDFSGDKLKRAIIRSMKDARQVNEGYADEIVQQIRKELEGKAHVESARINELVEQLLVKANYVEVAKMFLLHRVYKLWAENRANGYFKINSLDVNFSYNSLKVLEKRYLLKDNHGVIRETPTEAFRRVAKTIASAENNYGSTPEDTKELEDTFFSMMVSKDFLPNSPTLMNAGGPLGQLSACFVLPIGDSLEEIFDAVKHTALIHQSGGGTGFSFSRLRPNGDIVKSTGGIASGPISFMKVFDAGTETIKQGGRRRGANMGILRIDHPDIIEFINTKDAGNKVLSNFNISVAMTDRFVDALKNDGLFELLNPRKGEPVKELRAQEIFDNIVDHAWETGDPGIIFIDRINTHHPAKHIGPIEATNPCGEQPLLPYESCNLGSINLGNMVIGDDVDWDKLRRTTILATRFLDNVIDVNKYPIPQLKEMANKTRKIGLGVMGFADLLIKLNLQYDSDEGMMLGRKVMNFINFWSHHHSIRMARERGSFPVFKGSDYERGLFPLELDGFDAEDIPEHGVVWDTLRDEVKKGTRNLTNTTIAPTGSISIMAGCSSGIEPMFAIAFRRVVLENTTLLDVHPLFEKITKEMGIYNEKLMEDVAETGSIAHMNLPDELKKRFRTAHDIKPKWHVRVQGEFQRYTDNAVSKTINLPHDATPEDVANTYMMAHQMGCKGTTVYRDQSKSQQVIYFGLNGKTKEVEDVAKDLIEIANVNLSKPPEPKLVDNPLLEFKLKKPQVVVDSDFAGGCEKCDL